MKKLTLALFAGIPIFLNNCTVSTPAPNVATFHVDSENQTYISANVNENLVYGKETSAKDLPWENTIEVSYGDSLVLYTSIDDSIKANTEIRINGESVITTSIEIKGQCFGCRKEAYVFYR